MSADSIVAVVISNDRSKQESMTQVFANLPGFKVVAESADFSNGVQKVQGMAADVAVVFLDDRQDTGCAVLSQLKQARPDVFTFAISADRSADLIVKAIRSGADELLSQIPTSEELLAPLVKVMELRKREATAGGGTIGQILAGYSSHGGAGVTTFMTNLALSIKKMGEVRVCLVDLDLQNGDVPVFLNFKHPYSILDLTENSGSLDPTFLQGTLFHHASGLDVLAPPPMLEDGESISARDVTQILDALKSHFDYILVDTSSTLNDITFAVIEKADKCFLLTDNMVPSVRAMQRVANTLDRLGVTHENLKLVLSRPVEKSDITSQDISDVVKLDVAYDIPRDDATAIQAANRGVPAHEVNPKSPMVTAIEAVARAVTGVTSTSASKSSGLFGRFFSESRV